MKRDVLLIGIPRSGTTLLGALVGSLSNAVSISEPGELGRSYAESVTAHQFAASVIAYFEATRRAILETGHYVTKVHRQQGSTLTDYFIRVPGKDAEIAYTSGRERARIVDGNFTLAVKHNEPFLLGLPELLDSGRFSVVALLRDPIATIASWRSLHPKAFVHAPLLEQFGYQPPTSENVLVRQVLVFEFMLERILAHRDRLHLLRYEDLVLDPGIPETLFGRTYRDRSIEVRGAPRPVEAGLRDELREALRSFAPRAFAFFYS